MRTKMIIVSLVMFFGIVWFFPKQEETIWVDHPKIPLQMIKIDIRGAVDFPGIYHVFEPITIKEALSFAGNIKEDADLTKLQMSELITHDYYIVIPSLGDDSQEEWEKININEASFKELITIPGMTEGRAAQLIIYREAHGDFKTFDELINVKYIGVATLEKIKPYITL